MTLSPECPDLLKKRRLTGILTIACYQLALATTSQCTYLSVGHCEPNSGAFYPLVLSRLTASLVTGSRVSRVYQ